MGFHQHTLMYAVYAMDWKVKRQNGVFLNFTRFSHSYFALHRTVEVKSHSHSTGFTH